MIAADLAVVEVLSHLQGRPGFLVGSAVAAQTYDMPHAYSDVDVFFPHPNALMAAGQFMLDHGAVLDEQDQRKWNRWLLIGMGDWQTNSIRMELLSGIEVNLVYKVVGKKPLTSLMQVLESFDFGYVAMGYDLERGTFHDGREFWFGKGYNPRRMGFLPHREWQWLNATIGRFTGTRQPQRWAKFADRGHDMHPSQDVLARGLRITAAHYQGKDDPEYRTYAPLYVAIADMVEDYDIAGLMDLYSELQPHDPVGSLTKGLP